MAITVTQAAERYACSYIEWKTAVDAHRHALQRDECELQNARREKGQSEPRRCFEETDTDELGRNRWTIDDWCDGCKETLKWYEKRSRAARRKGAAHRVLIQTVERSWSNEPAANP